MFYDSYPCVNNALQIIRSQAFHGNTFNPNGEYSEVRSEMREVASNFDVRAELLQAIKIRSYLPVENDN